MRTHETLEPGTVLADKYRIDRFLAEGGMGIVYQGTHLELDTRVAIKVLHPSVRDYGDVLVRFVREARAVAKLSSEHIVRMLDVSTQDPDHPFMVMELLEGCDLEQMLDQRGKLSVTLAARFVRQACAGLQVAHAAGILHRDLKPGNFFLAHRKDDAPVVKILDFGLSKSMVKGENVTVTQPNEVFGSPSYMSPEQIAAEELDPRSDIFSLGAILFELVTGTSAFAGDTVPQTLVNIAVREPPPASQLVEGVPAEIDAIIYRAIAKNREDRYSTVREFSDALSRFEGSSPELPRSILPPPKTVPPPQPIALGPPKRKQDVTRRPVFIALVLGGATLVGIAAALLMKRDPARSSYAPVDPSALSRPVLVVTAPPASANGLSPPPNVSPPLGANDLPIVAPPPTTAKAPPKPPVKAVPSGEYSDFGGRK